jgi:DNA-binding response OmpR family regulator
MAEPRSETRILVVDADGEAAQRAALALDGAGFGVAWCSFAPTELSQELKDYKPTLLLVRAELASPQLATLIARLESAGLAALPVVLLCRDTSDEVFLRPLRTGVVEMLPEPFSPRPHLGRLRMLLAELPERSGKLRGRGGPNELAALVHHLMRTRRTGGIALGEGEEGRAFFVRGVLKSARYHAQTMQGALAAMARAETPWSYTEGLEGNAGVIDFDDEEEPFVVTQRERGNPVRMPVGVEPARVDPNRVADEGRGSGLTLPPAPPPPPLPALAAPPAPLAPAEPGRFTSSAPVSRLVPASASSAAHPALDADAARTRLLFVDDDTAVVQMLSSFFSKKGYQVVTAADGVEAMAHLGASEFDAVIADLNMPRLDGWGLLRMIREDLRTNEVPVALFSAQDNYRESLRLLHAGAQAYFPKTLRLTALEAQVKELLEPRRRFLRLVPSEGGMSFDFASLGTQWVCRSLSQAAFVGQLDARDSWGAWRLHFDQGRLAQATARMGATSLDGDRALAAFLASRNAEGTLLRVSRSHPEGFAGQPTQATLDRLVPWLNDEQRRAREDQLARARALTVHDELYRLYLTVGPATWLPIVRLLCEAKLPPAEVIARLQVTPMEVAAVVKDLLRRGVASLQ